MLKFTSKTNGGNIQIFSELTLTLDQRVKSRLLVTLDNGKEAGLFLERGSIMRGGDQLLAETGEVIVIKLADESVSTVYVKDVLLLSRACYHLGNRHVALQIDRQYVRYQHDHVLDEMLRGFGLEPTAEMAPFEPEPGAYSKNEGSHHAHTH